MTIIRRLHLPLFSICVLLFVANGWVTERPVNMVAVQGTTINFSCASNERGKVRWDFYKFGSVNPYDVWNGESAQNPFSVNVEQCQLETRCSLLAERVSRDIAGSYVCRRAAGFGEFLASLIVLDNETRCDLNVSSSNNVNEVQETDVVKVQCHVNYSGSWTPVIKCNHGTNVVNISTSSYVFYSALVNIQRNMTNLKIQCETFFDKGNIDPRLMINGRTESTNVPAFRSLWSSVTLNVKASESHIDGRQTAKQTKADQTTVIAVSKSDRNFVPIIVGVTVVIAILTVIANVVIVVSNKKGGSCCNQTNSGNVQPVLAEAEFRDEGTQLYAEINPIDEEVYPQQHQQLKMPKTHIPRESDAFLMEVSKSNTSIVGSGCSDREKSAEAHNQIGPVYPSEPPWTSRLPPIVDYYPTTKPYAAAAAFANPGTYDEELPPVPSRPFHKTSPGTPQGPKRSPFTPTAAAVDENIEQTSDPWETHEESSAALYADLDGDSSKPTKFDFSIFG